VKASTPWQAFRLAAAGAATLTILSGCGVFVPYKSEFECAGSYNGQCQSLDDALSDSQLGINPADFDGKTLAAKKAFEAKNPALVAERERRKAEAGTETEAADPSGSGFPGEGTAENVGYRRNLFEAYKAKLEKPQAPVIVPPQPLRALVLDATTGKSDDIYIPPHYVYFILDRPKWILKKLPEVHTAMAKAKSAWEPAGHAPNREAQAVIEGKAETVVLPAQPKDPPAGIQTAPKKPAAIEPAKAKKAVKPVQQPIPAPVAPEPKVK